MDREQFKIWKKAIAIILTVVFLFQPLVGVGIILAEGESVVIEATQTPTPPPELTTEPQNESFCSIEREISPTPSESSVNVNNKAKASDIQTTTITNNNSAGVGNNISVTANTGNNEISPASTPTPKLSTENLNGTPTPVLPEVTPTKVLDVEPTQNEMLNSASGETDSSSGSVNPPEILTTPFFSQPTASPNQDSGPSPVNNEDLSETTLALTEAILPIPTPLAEPLPTPRLVAENRDTPDDSQNKALCKSEYERFIANDNQAEIENEITATSSSGQNESFSEGSQTIETGEANILADLTNTVNFNVVGKDFWTDVFSLLGVNKGDLDFSSLDIQNQFGQALTMVLAQNLMTGGDSVNIAVTDFWQSLLVANNNIATVSNILDLSAISGRNTTIGGDGQIYTGSASIYANLFNLINTNLIGTNFWFGIFNIFGEQNGDIILPYELQFLQTEMKTGGVTALNENVGENSQNQANASSHNVTTIENTNKAWVDNTVGVLADSGTNTAVVGGSANINTGNATAEVDIRNFINTNIFGNRFVFLLINVFGEWRGALLGWWGNLFSDEKTTIASVQLSSDGSGWGNSVLAQNQGTGENSQNTAVATSTNNLTVNNNNETYLTNEIKGQAISGQNQVQSDSAKIETGNSSVMVNIANFVNTNIIGNNFFFGIINIFGNLCGNILFPRPDLEIRKSVDKATAIPGENLTYTMSYKNSGRLWAKDVVVDDTLPAGVTFISASGGGTLERGKVVWKLGKISSGDSGALSVAVKVNDNVLDNAELVNQVFISTSTDEPNKENNQSSATTIVRVVSSPEEGVGGPGGGGPGGDGPGGGGSTGEGAIYNGAGGGIGGGSSCIPPEAPESPTLLSATVISPTEVKLEWTAIEGVSYYLVAYGQSSGNYIYGSPNVGNVTSYVVRSLTSGKTYYFVVAGVVDNGCPIAGPFSNELFATPGGFGKIFGTNEVLAIFKEGGLGGGTFTEEGRVAGATQPVCSWWWKILLGEAIILGGFYGLILRKSKSPKFWWLLAPSLIILVFLGDKLAHHWLVPSQYCKYVPMGGIIIGGIETLGYKFLKGKL